ncbi:DNA-binding protein (plasmid) [Haloferax mediterranei ATCC 33500]|uniref:DNA-binding protein n=1 Tax=Haloferax mediterranei (strain ATCC 33500 / DSM 1411 / JCM 8866 / NBRC 14739 / NCIMB 2177 / R-4) TaxID=523841 RepID=I3RA53_HALMT|nr:helix-turn-helix domain-containing protein [Haloferax mediterranei]AFK21113.1 putative DNA binding protein [Haloferax mediterranei ATCC 33500]AHZ24301.1 DNA-binding protein [Haloferax mediterranei ATCC 33500]EMA05386.1 putative DNA binding protein [Haloferax mediterranei ATCC 33500]MDX5989815.1 helix-turn-helix domain-containing protein [Haloferax mediterranei ATCC 33500]QCQ77258.1 DNA-binding protein [Haloferax mediterranei ATCC 33500]
MGFVAEYEIACEALPLVEVAATVPDATLEVKMQPNHGGYTLFIVYVTGGTAVSVEEAFESATFVGEYTLVGQAGETRRYQISPAVSMEAQLGECIDNLSHLHSLASTESLIDRICVTPTGWIQSGWFADRATLDEFRTFWQRNGSFTLRRLTCDGEVEKPGEGLTDCQHEALRTAYGMGYFDIPRTATLDEVATELGITASSLSERLRRAQTHLIETNVGLMWPPLPE